MKNLDNQWLALGHDLAIYWAAHEPGTDPLRAFQDALKKYRYSSCQAELATLLMLKIRTGIDLLARLQNSPCGLRADGPGGSMPAVLRTPRARG